ncbi:MAG TPA: PfkB family carbohydrate kinase [Nitrososphaeraceae archaeon]|nr:PfkB family carbohydrate kinase [Nitrososphaeraceae archaeon]
MITVIGGTYNEYCFEPYWNEVFGSGLRGCNVILSLSTNSQIEYHTFLDSRTVDHLNSFKQLYPRFDFKCKGIEINPTFSYDHPLSSPRIFPRPDSINRTANHLDVTGENVLCFGILEGSATIHGENVVYDPQSPVNPISFSQTKSSANNLAIVINLREAERICKSSSMADMKSFFLEKEKANVLVLKMGPKGALVSTKNGNDSVIPVYKTPYVWPIGSGDVFASSFAYHWFDGMQPALAAERASYSTAEYCSTRGFLFSEIGSNTDFQKLIVNKNPEHQIYLAGPFFTFAQRWLIDQIRNSLLEAGLKVFSPFHDVGHGLAKDVVEKDIIGLKNSKLVLAVLDGLDSGTLFEVGYAVANNISVIGFAQKETSEGLKMVEGTNCTLEDDFATAVYKAYWNLAER